MDSVHLEEETRLVIKIRNNDFEGKVQKVLEQI